MNKNQINSNVNPLKIAKAFETNGESATIGQSNAVNTCKSSNMVLGNSNNNSKSNSNCCGSKNQELDLLKLAQQLSKQVKTKVTASNQNTYVDISGP